MRAPWKPASAGQRASALIELVGLYPTLVELMGLPMPKDKHPLEGHSFAALFDDPKADMPAGQQWALSQYARCPSNATAYNSPCGQVTPVNNDISVMGYSLRVPGWRYTECTSVSLPYEAASFFARC